MRLKKSRLILMVLVGVLPLAIKAQFRQPENSKTSSVNLHLPPSGFYTSKLRMDQRGMVFSHFHAFEFSYSPFSKLPGELTNQTLKFGQIPSTTLTSPLLRKDQLNIWLPGYQQVPLKQQITQGLFNIASGIYTYSKAKD